MKYFLIFSIFFIFACKKEVILSKPSFSSDPIHKEYEKSIKEMEKEKETIQKSIDEANERINDNSFNPKLADLIKNEIFVQEKHIRLIEQEIAYLRLKDNDRSIFYAKNQETLTEESINKDFEDYKVSEVANTKKYVWRLRPALVLPKDESKKTEEKDKKSAEKPKESSSHH